MTSEYTPNVTESIAAGDYSGVAGLVAVHNCRDVGRTINRFLGKKVMKEGVLYRSGRLDSATAADIDILTNNTNLRSIIDLRTNTELQKASEHNPTSTSIAAISSAIVHHVPVISSEYYRKALLAKLPWYRLVQILVYYILQFKTTAIRLLVELVIIPNGLERSACDMLLYCGPQIKSIFNILTEEKDYPALVYCTQGKDRTGLTILLVLLCILGDGDTEIKAIEYDYLLSNDGLKKVRQEILNEIKPYGYTEESGFADAWKGWVETVVGYIEEEWGGVEKYLASIGVDGDAVKRLRENLLVDPA